MKKRFVLSGYFGFKNFGDEAILSVLVNKLQEYKHRITVISSNPNYTRSKFKHIRSVQTFDFSSIIGSIAKSDCLISGGGSLLQDVTSFKSLIYYLTIIFIALFFNKKVIIFAQGIGPINNPISRWLTKNILKHCTYISVRDFKSQQILTKWGIKSDLLCDPVFSLELEHDKHEDSVAVQLRDFQTMTEDFIDRLAYKTVNEFKGKKINIIPLQETIDTKICHRFKKALTLLDSDINATVYENLTDNDIIKLLSKSEYLIAMRFHAIMVGIISGTKTLGINYDTKVEKLCKEFDLPYIELNKEFDNEFDRLKKLDGNILNEKAKNNQFCWNGFLDTINKL